MLTWATSLMEVFLSKAQYLSCRWSKCLDSCHLQMVFEFVYVVRKIIIKKAIVLHWLFKWQKTSMVICVPPVYFSSSLDSWHSFSKSASAKLVPTFLAYLFLWKLSSLQELCCQSSHWSVLPQGFLICLDALCLRLKQRFHLCLLVVSWTTLEIFQPLL